MGMTNAGERFQYISKGRFLIECIENKAYFDELVRNYLTVHVQNVINDEMQQEEMDFGFNNLEVFDNAIGVTRDRIQSVDNKVRHPLIYSVDGANAAEDFPRLTQQEEVKEEVKGEPNFRP